MKKEQNKIIYILKIIKR